MKQFLFAIFALSSLAFSQTKTVGPSGQGLAPGTNPAFKTALELGSAASLNYGTASGNLVRLDVTTGKLPAVDGSLLTNLPFVFANQAEAEGGTENTKIMTALRTAQAIAELTVGEVTLAGVETLTNKTLSDPKITISGGAGDQPGDMYYNDGTGTLMRLRLGDDGDTLIADAFTAKPVWGVSGKYLQKSNDLSDLTDVLTARNNLGLGTAAVLNHGTASGNLVRLDVTTGKLPAVDGSLLTNLPAGGLTRFTESLNTATPNATIPAAVLTANDAAASVDLVLMPKSGSGNILASIPDNTATGGNKRAGNWIVDLQRQRASANQIASGTNSTLSGGISNRVSGTSASCGGGSGNIVTGESATTPGGGSNTVSGAFGATSGGFGNTASGDYSFAAGRSNTASASYSVATGYSNTSSGTSSFTTGLLNAANSYGGIAIGAQSSTRGVGYAFVQAASALATVGDAQVGRYVFRAQTSSATPTKLMTDTTGSLQQVTLPNNSTYSFMGQVSARSSGGDSAAWRFTGTIERGANAAATALIGTPTITDTNAEAGAAAWTISITADTTNGAISITATGAAATNIRWVAQVETAEVVY
jgi:hypothetical protein